MGNQRKLKHPQDQWLWKGMPGHFCAADRCRFRLHTVVGPYKISTVGALYINDSDKKMSEIGYDREYETFVFVGDSLSEIDGEGISLHKDAGGDPYKADELAETMHMEMCFKYAMKE